MQDRASALHLWWLFGLVEAYDGELDGFVVLACADLIAPDGNGFGFAVGFSRLKVDACKICNGLSKLRIVEVTTLFDFQCRIACASREDYDLLTEASNRVLGEDA